MAREMTGTGRVTLFPLLHVWPDVYGVGAYTTTGRFGATAIVGYIPIPEVPDMRFFDIAARHLPGSANDTALADWVLCTAWSARSVPKPGTLDLHAADWVFEWEARHDRDGVSKYGHSDLYIGRLQLADEVLMKQAVATLPEPAT
ncbi:hypothetical protein [Streptomyces fradiae]|uniref:hypothetical protein n=1 Tax=Streptomyces fradiae TaxID=1906 RepID=UPI0035BE9179